MNLKTSISPKLWSSVSKAYEAKNYCHAITDAMHHLTSLLRDKSGLDLDGADLVNKALGGKEPKLLINKLQTQTEKSIQEGIAFSLRGLYQAVRNPRSHGQVTDTKETADAIICYLNYLLEFLESASEKFTIHGLIEKVNDPLFVKNDRYIKLLVSDIPERKLSDSLVELSRVKSIHNIQNLSSVTREILPILPNDKIQDFLDLISEELLATESDEVIRNTLLIMTPSLWYRVDEIVKIRIENRIIESIEEDSYNFDKWHNDCTTPTLGAAAVNFFMYFELKNELANLLLDMISGRVFFHDTQIYVFNLFLPYLPQLGEQYSDTFIHKICNVVKEESEASRNHNNEVNPFVKKFSRKLTDAFEYYPDSWLIKVVKELPDYSSEIEFAKLSPNRTHLQYNNTT